MTRPFVYPTGNPHGRGLHWPSSAWPVLIRTLVVLMGVLMGVDDDGRRSTVLSRKSLSAWLFGRTRTGPRVGAASSRSRTWGPLQNIPHHTWCCRPFSQISSEVHIDHGGAVLKWAEGINDKARWWNFTVSIKPHQHLLWISESLSIAHPKFATPRGFLWRLCYLMLLEMNHYHLLLAETDASDQPGVQERHSHRCRWFGRHLQRYQARLFRGGSWQPACGWRLFKIRKMYESYESKFSLLQLVGWFAWSWLSRPTGQLVPKPSTVSHPSWLKWSDAFPEWLRGSLHRFARLRWTKWYLVGTRNTWEILGRKFWNTGSGVDVSLTN